MVGHIGDIAYHLELPPLIAKIYPTFHVGLLKRYISSGDILQYYTTPTIEDKRTREYGVAKIIKEHVMG